MKIAIYLWEWPHLAEFALSYVKLLDIIDAINNLFYILLALFDVIMFYTLACKSCDPTN